MRRSDRQSGANDPVAVRKPLCILRQVQQQASTTKGAYGRRVGGFVTYARRGDDLAAGARRGFEARWIREAREADVDGRLTDEQIAAAARELQRSHMRAIARRPRPSRRRVAP